MPTPAPGTMVLRTVYLPKALDNELRDRAFGLSLSKGEFIRILVQESLARRAAEERPALSPEIVAEKRLNGARKAAPVKSPMAAPEIAAEKRLNGAKRSSTAKVPEAPARGARAGMAASG